MWRHAFGGNLELLLGVDINPKTTAWEAFGKNVKVAIGSQADPAFLSHIKGNYSDGFDIILDDGSHVPEHMFTTFALMWPLIRPGGVYLIEDVHGNNPLLDWLFHGHEVHGIKWPGMLYGGKGTLNKFQSAGFREGSKSSGYQRDIESVKMYPYILAVTKREKPLETMRAVRHGSQWIPY